jgi:hypothetical protein
MTDVIWDRLRDRWLRLRQEGAEPVPPPPPHPDRLVVDVRLPRDSSDTLCETLEKTVRRILERRTQELGIDRKLDVGVRSAGPLGSAVEISVRGRPLALCDLPAPATAGWGYDEAIERRIDKVVRQRLVLVLDDEDVAWHAKRWQSACDDRRANLYLGLPAYLLGNGLRLGVPSGFAPPPAVTRCDTVEELAEVLLDAAAPRVLDLQVCEDVLRRRHPDLADGFDTVRSAVFSQWGVQLPDLRIRPVAEQAAPRIMLNHLSDAGDSSLDSWPLVLGWLHAAFTEFAACFVRLSDVSAAWNQLLDIMPDLATVSSAAFNDAQLTACLRCLVRNKDSVRNQARVMWLLLDLDGGARPSGFRIADLDGAMTGRAGGGAERLASHVRKRMSDEAWQAGLPERPLEVVTLPPELEQALAAQGATRADAEWELVRAVRSIGAPVEVAVAARDSLDAARHALGALADPPRVVASEELSPDVVMPRLPVPAR